MTPFLSQNLHTLNGLKACRLILLALLISSWPNYLFGQGRFVPGSVISLQGDTLHGEVIEFGGIKNYEKCQFRINKKSAVQIFAPGEIRGFFIENRRYFESLPNPTPHSNAEYIFGEWLIQGFFGVLKFKSRFYFYSGDNDIVEQVPFNKEATFGTAPSSPKSYISWQLFINRLSQKCTSTKNFLSTQKQIPPKLDLLIALVKLLNDCYEYPYVHFGSDLPASILSLGISTAFSRTYLNFNTNNEDRFSYLLMPHYQFTSPGVSISITGYNPARWRPLRTKFSIMGRALRFEHSSQAISGGHPTIFHTSFKWLDAGVALGIQYDFIRSNPQISLELGPTTNFFLRKEAQLIEQTIRNDNGSQIITTNTRQPFSFGTFQPGYYFQITLSGKPGIIPGRWEISSGIQKGAGITAFDEFRLNNNYVYTSRSTILFLKTTWWWKNRE